MIKAELVHLNKDKKFVKVARIIIPNESGRFFDRVTLYVKINGKKIGVVTLNFKERNDEKTMLLPIEVDACKTVYSEVYIEKIYDFNLLQSLLK